VCISRDDDWPQYDAHYKYDNRDQLLEEQYLRYNESTYRMEVYRERIYEYDNGGNLTMKKIAEGDDWIAHAFDYAKGYEISSWTCTISSGTVSISAQPTYDTNGNLTSHGSVTVSNGGPEQFELTAMTFTYDRKNRLQTYQYGDGPTKTLTWDALGRIREKTWTENSTDYHQVFYHSGRQLVQIWNETVDGYDITREIAYDLFSGQAGYLKDIDFDSDPDNEGYLIKDAQGTVRAIVNVTYSGGTYTVTTERYDLDGYGATLNFDSYPHDNGTHYMRYISCRVEDYADTDNETQALIHTDYRHYLPHFGIFLQREPLLTLQAPNPSDPLSSNPYRYSENSPVILTDASGYTAIHGIPIGRLPIMPMPAPHPEQCPDCGFWHYGEHNGESEDIVIDISNLFRYLQNWPLLSIETSRKIAIHGLPIDRLPIMPMPAPHPEQCSDCGFWHWDDFHGGIDCGDEFSHIPKKCPDFGFWHWDDFHGGIDCGDGFGHIPILSCGILNPLAWPFPSREAQCRAQASKAEKDCNLKFTPEVCKDIYNYVYKACMAEGKKNKSQTCGVMNLLVAWPWSSKESRCTAEANHAYSYCISKGFSDDVCQRVKDRVFNDCMARNEKKKSQICGVIINFQEGSGQLSQEVSYEY